MASYRFVPVTINIVYIRTLSIPIRMGGYGFVVFFGTLLGTLKTSTVSG